MSAYSTFPQQAPIAVFDSGLGGLTVVQALRRLLPLENLIYFGDTARVPYGGKSADTVTRFAREICEFLIRFEPKIIIAACNTVSALALPTIRSEFSIPIVGVVQSSALRAALATRKELVAVLGTEATIASGAFERAIRQFKPHVRVVQQSCPLFVPLVEEGRSTDDVIVRLTLEDYLAPIRQLQPDVVLLGCTHYPILHPALRNFFGPDVTLISSGEAVAGSVQQMLQQQNLLCTSRGRGTVQCYVTDFPQRFSSLGNRFLGEPIGNVIRASIEPWIGPTTPTTIAATA